MVVCICVSGGEYSCDQLHNITAFSLLRRWLLTTLSSGAMTAPSPSPAPTPTLQEHYRGQVLILCVDGLHSMLEIHNFILVSGPYVYRNTAQSTVPFQFTNFIPIPQVISSPGVDRYSSSRTMPSFTKFPTSLPSPLSSALLQTLSLTGGAASPGGMASLTSSLITSVDGRSRQGLKEVAVQYCLRIIDQSERSESVFSRQLIIYISGSVLPTI